MKKVFLALLLLCTFSMSSVAYSQSYYTTQSKSCGSCGKEVSINSTVGMRCPHCGVIWGRENEHRTTTKKTNSYNKSYNSSNYNYSNSSNINNSKSYDMTPAKTITTASLRKGASAKSELLFNIPKDRNVYIVGKKAIGITFLAPLLMLMKDIKRNYMPIYKKQVLMNGLRYIE